MYYPTSFKIEHDIQIPKIIAFETVRTERENIFSTRMPSSHTYVTAREDIE